MNLVEINQNINRLLANIWAVVAFLKLYITGTPQDVSITMINSDGTETTHIFANIPKQLLNASSIAEWTVGETDIAYGSDGKFYYPNITGNPATNDPAIKSDDADWYGAFDTMGGAILMGDTIVASNAFANLIEDLTPQLGGALDCNGKTINGSSVRQIADASPANATTHVCNYALGDMQKITCPNAGAITLALSGFPAGVTSGFILDVVNGGSCTITYPAGMEFDEKSAPVFTAVGTDRVLITSDKNGVFSLVVSARNTGTII